MSPSIPVPHLSEVAAQRERHLLQAHTSWLHDELARQMAGRLTVLKQRPKDWLDWLPSWGGGSSAPAVQAVLPEAKRWVHQPTQAGSATSWPGFLRKVLPTRAWDGRTAVDMLWANMGLRSITEPEPLLAQWLQALAPGGLLMFSALGPHSLQSVREIYQQQAWGEAATPFVDMHDWGDQLMQAGFIDPVMDASFIDLTYSSAETLVDDLRLMGRNTHAQRFAACRTPAWRRALLQALHAGLPRDAQGRLVLTLEVLWGQAWRPMNARASGEVTTIAMTDMQAMLRRQSRG